MTMASFTESIHLKLVFLLSCCLSPFPNVTVFSHQCCLLMIWTKYNNLSLVVLTSKLYLRLNRFSNFSSTMITWLHCGLNDSIQLACIELVSIDGRGDIHWFPPLTAEFWIPPHTIPKGSLSPRWNISRSGLGCRRVNSGKSCSVYENSLHP